MERTYTGEQMVEEWIESIGRQQAFEGAVRTWELEMLAYNHAVSTWYVTGFRFPKCPDYPFPT